MEIERINENTVKFYISYVDIESRGFEREEIWYNRERSEQLFWQMMDEVNYKEDFPVEGPLWIQVQALEKGLEIIVTKAQINNNNSLDSLDDVESLIDITITNKQAEHELDQLDEDEEDVDIDVDQHTNIWITTRFQNFEDVIRLSYYFQNEYEHDIETALFHYEDHYYLYMEIPTSLFTEQENIISQILEFSTESQLTKHVLAEYGNVVIDNNVFEQIRSYF